MIPNDETLLHRTGGSFKGRLWLGLENTLNDGSPSGFEAIVDSQYSCGSLDSGYLLPAIAIDKEAATVVGRMPDAFFSDQSVLIPIHPQILRTITSYPDHITLHEGFLDVVPTASQRTVFAPSLNACVKLHFPMMIGRYSRDLSLFKWISAIERSRELQALACADAGFEILPELDGAFLLEDLPTAGGVILRDMSSLFCERRSNRLLIPAFSMFAERDGHPPVIVSIIEHFGLDTKSCFELFLKPLIYSFWTCATKVGLIPEMNAQNVLFEVDPDTAETRIVLRDTGDFFVDLSMRTDLGKHTSFCTYKTISRDSDSDYFERRSFAFDFKLGEYILEPIIEAASSLRFIEEPILRELLREFARSRFGTEYFGSSDYWYRYPKRLGTSRNAYERVQQPKFR